MPYSAQTLISSIYEIPQPTMLFLVCFDLWFAYLCMFGAEPKFQGNFWASCDSVDLKLCLAKFSGPSPRGTRARGFSLGKKD